MWINLNATRFLSVYTAVIAVSAVAAQPWTSGPALPGTPPRAYAAGVNQNGTFFVIGGVPLSNNGGSNTTVHYLQPGAGAWTVGVPAEGGIVRQGAGIDAFGRIVVFGGVDGVDPNGGDPGATYVYDIIEGQRQGLANRGSAAQRDHFAFAPDAQRRLYTFGGGPGEAATAGRSNSDYVERYIAATDSWQPVAPLPAPRAEAAAVNDGRGHILVIGGFDATASMRTSTVFEYDVAGGVWSDASIPDLPVRLTGHAAVLGSNERIYVLGGVTGPTGAGTTVDSVYVLHLDSRTWSSGPNMPVARSHFAVVHGDDDHIYAFGGLNEAGGTNSVDKLYTPPCPVITTPPASQAAWRDTAAGFSVAAEGGAPMAYQWQKDGVDLANGPGASGSVISGATSEALLISGPVQADAGAYTVVVSNACGDTVSAPALLTIRIPPAIPDQWEVVNIHPGWAQMSSYARGVSNGRIGGAAMTPTVLPDGRTFNLDHPVVWDTQSLVPLDVTPAGSVGGGIFDVEGDLLVGWFWHTWQCWGGTRYWTCAWKSAGFWTAPALAFQESIHSSGAEFDSLYATDGRSMVGTLTYEYSQGNYTSQAYLWTSPSAGRSLHFSAASNTGASAVDGEYQYGHSSQLFGRAHATRWHGASGSHLDLHPTGLISSLINGAGDGQAVGTADSHAGLWIGDGVFIDLNPSGAANSSAVAVQGGIQAGAVDGGAALWVGAPDSYFNLGAILPPNLISSTAEDFEVLPDGSMIVVGSGFNSASGRQEALVWRSAAAPPIPGDIDGDGDVDLADLAVLLAAFGQCTGDGGFNPAADFDGSGCVELGDLAVLLANFGT